MGGKGVKGGIGFTQQATRSMHPVVKRLGVRCIIKKTIAIGVGAVVIRLDICMRKLTRQCKTQTADQYRCTGLTVQ